MPKTHPQRSVSILIPSVTDPESSSIVKSFQESARLDVFIQFVFLLNPKHINTNTKASIRSGEGYQIVTVPNDRYFGSCEENLYRAQDFTDLLCEYVFCVGDHDAIDWKGLSGALDSCIAMNLDAMAWNINSLQKKSTGGYCSLSAVEAITANVAANQYCQILMNNQPLSSSVGFPAMIALYGFIDWAAYVGSHVYRKRIFQRVLQYKFSEHIYSFVYKQLIFFSTNRIRYGFYKDPVVSRISDDFLTIKEGRHSFGWLEEHRTVHGLSKCFWVANLQYLNEIRSEDIFNLVTNSLCLSQRPKLESETVEYVHAGALRHILGWCLQSLRHKLEGRSHYFGEFSGSSALGDLFTCSVYLRSFSNQLRDSEIYSAVSADFKREIASGSRFLDQYLNAPIPSELLLANAFVRLGEAFRLAGSLDAVSLNDRSFLAYLSAQA